MVSVRAATDEDEGFLFELYAESRAREVAAWGWGAAEADTFLRMQHTAQRRYYAASTGAATLIAEAQADGAPVRCGRLIVVDGPEEVRLADVLIQSRYRGRGIGSELLEQLKRRASSGHKRLRLSVEHQNEGARRLYERSGFVTVGASQTHLEMEWTRDLA